jgi:hypothetical protein
VTRQLVLYCLIVPGLACGAKPDWHSYDVGPFTMEFPCAPEQSAAVVKCMMSDGAKYTLATVDKGIAADQELAQMRQYVKAQPKTTVIDVEGFPVKWREIRQFRKLDSWLYYVDGKEYTFSVEFPTEKAPPTAAKFFARIKAKGTRRAPASHSCGAAPAGPTIASTRSTSVRAVKGLARLSTRGCSTSW